MPVEAYAVAVAAKLEDGVTPALLRIIESLERANALMLDFAAAARTASRAGAAVGAGMGKAAAGAAKLSDAAAGLTRASYVLDTMAATSADLARNMDAARAAGAGLSAVPPRAAGAGGGGALPPRVGAPESRGGEFSKRAAGAVGIGAALGIYENARLQHINLIATATSQVPFADWTKHTEALRALEIKYAKEYAVATHGKIVPFGQAILESSRLLRTLPQEEQFKLLDAAMKFAAYEAAFKQIPLPHALEAFIGLAHQAGAYTPAAAEPLFESMAQASLTTHASLDQIARAASYALPTLHAAGANSSDVLMMLATMMQVGILNTKSGTWLNDMAQNALPNALGSGLFTNKRQNAALQALGLYADGKSQFYSHGQFNLMREVAILAAARERMGPLEFNAATRQAFGLQGQRAASLFAEPQVVSNLHALEALTSKSKPPVDIMAQLNKKSAIAKADQTIANATIMVMNATDSFMGPLNWALGKMGSFFGGLASFTKAHPAAGGIADAGLAVGAAGVLGAAWKGSALAVEGTGKIIARALAWGLRNVVKGGLVRVAAMSGEALWALAAEAVASPIVVPALAVAIAGAVGYGIGKLINGAINLVPHMLGHKNFDFSSWVGDKVYDAFHPAPETKAPIVVHSTVMLDGKKVGESVTKHQTGQVDKPPVAPNNWIFGLSYPTPAAVPVF